MKKILLLFSLAISLFSQAQLPRGKGDIYLLVGQSNMAGRGKVEPVDTITYPQIWMLTKDEQWVPAKEPLSFDKPTVAGVGPGFAFAREITRSDLAKNILLVPSAVGGTRIDLWKPGAYDSTTNTHPYDDAIRRARTAMRSGTLKGIIWHQGESDSNPLSSAGYEAKLRELIYRFRADLNSPDVPFIAGEISNFRKAENKQIGIVNDAIRSVTSSVPHAAFVSTAGLEHRGDSLHFSSRSARELGVRYATVFLQITP